MNAPRKKRNRKEQRAARQLAKERGLTYMQALQEVRNNRGQDDPERTSASPAQQVGT
jgi:hypothetical protein